MEPLLLPIAFSPETPEGILVQDASQGSENFAEVLGKQFTREGNPPPGVLQTSLEDLASAATAKTFPAPVRGPQDTVSPEEKPVSDRTFAGPADEESPPSPPMDLSSLFLLSNRPPVPWPGPQPNGKMREEKAPILDERPSPSVGQARDGGTPPPPVFFFPANGEKNQETSVGEGKISPGSGQQIFPAPPSEPSMGQEARRTPPENSSALPDFSPSPASGKELIQGNLTANTKMGMERENTPANPIDSSFPNNLLEEPVFMEPTGKMDRPSGNEKKALPFSDSLNSTLSFEEVPQKESRGWTVLSSGTEMNEFRPRHREGMNGVKENPGRESNAFFSSPQPSPEMEAEPRMGEGRLFQKGEFSITGGKETAGVRNPQNLQEGELPGRTETPVPGPMEREWGVHTFGKEGKTQEKVFWTGADFRPHPDGKTQNYPPSVGALTELLNLKGENEGKIMEASPSFSPKPEPLPVSQQVGQRVLWLIRNNEERIRISLEPPELGQVFLEIDRHKEHVKTVLWTDNATAKATLENSQGEVQKIIESGGLKLEKFSVFVQQDPGWFQGRKENPGRSDTWQTRMTGEGRSPSADSVEPVPGRTPGRHPSSRYLDLLI